MLLKFKENMWSLLALCILGAALLTSRGGLAALMPVMRIVVPFIAVYLIFKFIKKKLTSKFQEALKGHLGTGGGPIDPQKIAEILQNRSQKNQGQVIDLCPKCGTYLSPGHRCKKS
jgi:hypothetical protein